MKIRTLSFWAFLFLVFSVAIGGCSGQSKVRTEEEKQRELIVKNKIKKITEYRTEFLLGIKQDERITEIKYFSNKGLPEKQISFNSEGQPEQTITYVYNDRDSIIGCTAINKDSSLAFRETTDYDSHNNRKEHYHYLADETYKYRNIASYDNKNRMTELAWYWPAGFRSKNVYTYNGNNKVTDTEFSETGEKTYEWNYKYDSKNNLIEAVQFYSGNVLTQKIIYEYNEHNLLIKKTNYQADSVSGSIVFAYDSANLIISRTEYMPSGKVASITRYSYE